MVNILSVKQDVISATEHQLPKEWYEALIWMAE